MTNRKPYARFGVADNKKTAIGRSMLGLDNRDRVYTIHELDQFLEGLAYHGYKVVTLAGNPDKDQDSKAPPHFNTVFTLPNEIVIDGITYVKEDSKTDNDAETH